MRSRISNQTDASEVVLSILSKPHADLPLIQLLSGLDRPCDICHAKSVARDPPASEPIGPSILSFITSIARDAQSTVFDSFHDRVRVGPVFTELGPIGPAPETTTQSAHYTLVKR